jgi:peptidoglycan hydrolase-like protein with peptidoglycan-binding domain
VQRALALAAYGPVGVDGFVGPQTREAIMRFQRDHNLPVTGEISDSLVIELRAAGALDEE